MDLEVLHNSQLSEYKLRPTLGLYPSNQTLAIYFCLHLHDTKKPFPTPTQELKQNFFK